MAKKAKPIKWTRPKKATASDARLVLRLYDLRLEEVMRKARFFVTFDWYPKSSEEIMQLFQAIGTPENSYFRQVNSYWTMACTLVLSGALSRDLFLRASGGELHILYAKVRRFLPEIRKIVQGPVMADIEAVLEADQQTRDTIAKFEQWVAMAEEMRKKQAAAAGS